MEQGELGMNDGYLTDDEYVAAYGKVPRLCVDLVIRNEQGSVLLTRRTQKPHIGWWHIPGGRVRKGEPVYVAAHRIAVAELGADVEIGDTLGFIEFLNDPGDLVVCHSVSIALSCKLFGEIKTPSFAWFDRIPTEEMHPVHQRFLQQQIEENSE
jgi:ADP-ribose pyrophosphatase YjhB (NUDIX family)